MLADALATDPCRFEGHAECGELHRAITVDDQVEARVVDGAEQDRDQPGPWRCQGEQLIDDRAGAGPCGDDRHFARCRVGGGQAEGVGKTGVGEHALDVGDDGAGVVERLVLGSLLHSGEVLDAIDVEPDREHLGIGQVFAGTELEHDRAYEVLGGALVTVDAHRAERLQVDEHLRVVTCADRDQAGHDRGQPLGRHFGERVVQQPP